MPSKPDFRVRCRRNISKIEINCNATSRENGCGNLRRKDDGMNKEDMDAVDILCEEILKYINRAAKEKVTSDVTYKSAIRNITPKGYVVLDRAGSERTVQCCIPGIELRIGQGGWVKEPRGRLNDIHICGVVGRTGTPDRNRGADGYQGHKL